MTTRPPARASRWWRLLWLAPPALLLLVVTAPLLTGARTLTLRDILNAHYALRISLGDALRAGELPLVDPLRSGGEALAGNANALPFYPDNLLLLLGSTLWQLNVHFVLHWFVAFAAMYWLGRAWGLRTEGAAGAATAYAFSGYWFSQMNLFNAVAVVALAPALWAALLEAGRPATRRRGLLALGLVWGLMLLGGDPPLAVIALAGGAVVALARYRETPSERPPWTRLAVAGGLGTLLAAPQIVETLRILPATFRAVQGYGHAQSGIRDPRAAIDLIVPLFFGRPDLGSIWGKELFGGYPPIYFTLALGLVAAALALVAGRPRRVAARWLAGAALLALIVTFSGGTFLPALLAHLPGAGLFRYLEKVFLVTALAFALAAGSGLERVVTQGAAGRLARRLLALLVAVGGLWALFGVTAAGGEPIFRALFGDAAAGDQWAAGHLRWAGLSMFGVAIALVGCGMALLGRRWPVAAGIALLTLHAGSQWLLLRPLLHADEAARYRSPPPLAREVPDDAVLVQGVVYDLFGADDAAAVARTFPDRRHWRMQRHAWSELYTFAALGAGKQLEFAGSPEGLDSFVSTAVASGMRSFDDPQRIAVLRATGVDLLLLPRALAPEGAGGAVLQRSVPGPARTMRIYEIPAPLPEVTLAGSIVRAPHMNAALEAIWRLGFDPATTAVIPGAGAPVVAPSGSARLVVSERERAEVEIDSPAGGVLILRRAHLPIWRATIDGEPAPTVIAQLTRLAVEVPPGPHRVVFSISRWPLRISSAAALLALVALGVLWRRDGRRGDGPGAGEVAA